MAKLTRVELIEQIDWERRENNAKFISQAQTIKLLDRAVKRIIREPGIRTIEALQNITASGSTSRYALEDDFKELISLWSGEGSENGVRFTYLPHDEYHAYSFGYKYTFLEPGYIDILFPDTQSLPSTTLKNRYWTKNIVVGSGGTAKTTWDDDADTSRFGEEFDDFYVMWCTAKILKREGKKEWKDYADDAEIILSMLKEQPASKTRRPMRQFGFLSG